jgi:hypothetical protein
MVDLLHSKEISFDLAQSSIGSDGNPIFGPQSAVDANIQTYIHTTQGDENPFWSVIFSNTCYFNEIEIFSSDNGPYRFRDIYIQIYDKNDGLIYTSDLLNPENIENGPKKVSVNLEGKNIIGKRIVIKRQPDPDYSGQGGGPGGDPAGSYLLLISEVQIVGYQFK